MQIKQYGIIEKAKKLAEGEIEFIVSTNALDAHGERIDVSGISLKDYQKNPVILWAHNGFDLPIAKATKIWKSKGKLMAKAQFDMDDMFPRKVYSKIVNGFLNAVSIGGQVDEWSEDGVTIKKMNMKEFSVVSIPANPEALATANTMSPEDLNELDTLAKAYALKILHDPDIDLAEKIDVLEKTVATLKEVASSEPNVDKASHRRVILRQAQVVDKQAETIIVTLKKG